MCECYLRTGYLSAGTGEEANAARAWGASHCRRGHQQGVDCKEGPLL